jgi:hypothetical protein
MKIECRRPAYPGDLTDAEWALGPPEGDPLFVVMIGGKLAACVSVDGDRFDTCLTEDRSPVESFRAVRKVVSDYFLSNPEDFKWVHHDDGTLTVHPRA